MGERGKGRGGKERRGRMGSKEGGRGGEKRLRREGRRWDKKREEMDNARCFDSYTVTSR